VDFEESPMNWLLRYRIRFYVHNSIWLLPALSIVAAVLAVKVLTKHQEILGWQLAMSPETGRILMGTIAASLFTLVVVSLSALLLAVQLASVQLTPRIITFVYRSRIRKFSLVAFVFTFTFSLAVLIRIEDSVPWLMSYAAAYGFLLSLALFLYFIDGMGKTLRPSTALRAVAMNGRHVIRTVYPNPFDNDQAPPKVVKRLVGIPRRIVLNHEDGVVLAFDLKGLVSRAQRGNCVIELVPEVGDFIAAGDPLFRVFEGGDDLPSDALRNSVALGQERTLEQDPMFAFRIIVDIASKALSPAVNDPTTAVLAIDQIHHLLRDVGSRYLAEGREVDRAGQLRLAYRTPNWEDFVNLAVTEIRLYGRDSIQVMRRSRAMLENLIETLPERRRALLSKELHLLECSATRTFPDLHDQALAQISDLQGLGGTQVEHSHLERAEPEVAGLIVT
jgi:uncharacterized membrane protein